MDTNDEIFTINNDEIFLYDSASAVFCKHYCLRLDEGTYIHSVQYTDCKLIIHGDEELCDGVSIKLF